MAAAALSVSLGVFGKPEWPLSLQQFGSYLETDLVPVKARLTEMQASQVGGAGGALRWGRTGRGAAVAASWRASGVARSLPGFAAPAGCLTRQPALPGAGPPAGCGAAAAPVARHARAALLPRV